MNLASESFRERHAVKCELAAEVLRCSGTLRLRVTGWSMMPTIWPGDTLIVKRGTASTVEQGDIVLFECGRRIFAHRVLRKSNNAAHEQILTCGDAMPQPDPPVSAKDVLGTVALILRNGKQREPAKRLRFPQRSLAGLFRRSKIAARVIAGVHGRRRSAQIQLF